MLGLIRLMASKDNDGDRVWNGLKLSDDFLTEKEIRAYLDETLEFNTKRFMGMVHNNENRNNNKTGQRDSTALK